MSMPSPSRKADTLSHTGKRLRTSKPKVRSGCITCKARRIKCDEVKPACDRCTKFGRECGGYKQPLTYEERVSTRSRQNLLPKTEQTPPSRPASSTSHRLATTFGLTPPQSFCVEASLELCRFLDQPHWISTSLQICKQHPCLRHAFTAIRLLSKSPSSSDAYDPSLALTTTIDRHSMTDNRPPATLHNECFLQGAHEVLPNGYCDPARVNLSAFICLLRICLDTLQFQSEPAFQNIHLGLPLINQLLKSQASSPSPSHLHQGVHTTDMQLDASAIHELINMLGLMKAKMLALDRYFNTYADPPMGLTSPFLDVSCGPQSSSLIEDAMTSHPSHWHSSFGNKVITQDAMNPPVPR